MIQCYLKSNLFNKITVKFTVPWLCRQCHNEVTRNGLHSQEADQTNSYAQE